MTRLARACVALSAIAATALTVGAAVNCTRMPSLVPIKKSRGRRLNPSSGRPDKVALLLPVRDEESNIEACLTSLLEQAGVDEVLVLDDGSADRTAEFARAVGERDPRFSLLVGGSANPPSGWLGKPWACQRLAEATDADVLMFVDADVTLNPGSAQAASEQLRELDLAMLCPYPKQETTTALTRLVQPLLQWSWLTFIPYSYSMRAQPPSMAVGNGQFAVFDALSYRTINGHAAVSDEVVEDVALARILRRRGLRTAVVDGHDAATCRMYSSDRALIDGYTKSLWQAFGTPVQSWLTLGFLGFTYLLPASALLSRDSPTRMWAACGLTASVTGRLVVAQRTGQRAVPDSVFAPLSIAALIGLTALSKYRRSRNMLRWKGRAV